MTISKVRLLASRKMTRKGAELELSVVTSAVAIADMTMVMGGYKIKILMNGRCSGGCIGRLAGIGKWPERQRRWWKPAVKTPSSAAITAALLLEVGMDRKLVARRSWR